MSVHTFQVIFQGDSGLAEDRYVNTFHFEGAGSDYDNVRDMLFDLYSQVNPFGQAISTHMTSQLGLNPRVVAYDLSDTKPRVPVYEADLGVLTYGAGEPLPYEVALCLSFEAAKLSGVSQRRRRNRVYIGPFRESENGGDGRPTLQMREDFVYAATQMLNASDASVSWNWVVYSPTDDDWALVDHIWVDDAWDTQRRRGNAPSVRESWKRGDPPYDGSGN